MSGTVRQLLSLEWGKSSLSNDKRNKELHTHNNPQWVRDIEIIFYSTSTVYTATLVQVILMYSSKHAYQMYICEAVYKLYICINSVYLFSCI